MNELRKFTMRRIDVIGATYLRSEDVLAFIREIAATEETDVRNRLNFAADNIERSISKKAGAPMTELEIKIQEVEQKLIAAIERAKADGFNIHPNRWNIQPKNGFWSVMDEGKCLCPMGAIILGTTSLSLMQDASEDAACALGISPIEVRSFTAGFDCAPGGSLFNETFFKLGAKFRAAWEEGQPRP